MLDVIPGNALRRRDDDYSYVLSQSNYNYLHRFPKHKLIYNWNNLPVLVKSFSEPLRLKAELKKSFPFKI